MVQFECPRVRNPLVSSTFCFGVNCRELEQASNGARRRGAPSNTVEPIRRLTQNHETVKKADWESRA